MGFVSFESAGSIWIGGFVSPSLKGALLDFDGDKDRGEGICIVPNGITVSWYSSIYSNVDAITHMCMLRSGVVLSARASKTIYLLLVALISLQSCLQNLEECRCLPL